MRRVFIALTDKHIYQFDSYPGTSAVAMLWGEAKPNIFVRNYLKIKSVDEWVKVFIPSLKLN